ncbi:amidohydrolase family protein-like protein [Westerdykella ornata]|uniref:Amidohydrolase family protein-like protein n=1 Tax=Westerdykella ornata TaxID=318751 RepID=A0A6A6JUG3_WESOR|nr:amidohydrolase family protein-like protein [Westerdykella ornata]KAF2279885.1 amidohydrolase family protein-like protein [Westerdykella ornata]
MVDTENTLLFINGRFFNGADSAASFSTAMVVKDGKIAYIGPSDSPEIQMYKNTAVTQDLRNSFILPGFLDGHCHFLLLGQALHKVKLDGCNDLSEIRQRIKTYAFENPEKERILCSGWMHSMTNGEAKASMLDDLDPRPIFIDSKDLHSAWCNSAALAEMGVQNMADPAGGSIERDEIGNPSGLLSEAAAILIVWPHLAKVATMEEKKGALRAAVAAYHQVGVTGCIDMAMDENAWEAILALREELGGHLPLRIAAHWIVLPGEGEAHRLEQVTRAVELFHQFNKETSPDLRIVGIKIICDGVIDACTAALTEPHSHNGESPDPIWTPDMLAPVVKKACEAKLQCALHAIGDQAVHNAINALEAYGKPGQRHRIEHLELTSPQDAARLGKLGITASVQPVHADPAILRAWPKLLGPERLKRAFAYKEFADNGAVLAIGSDCPTAPHAPMSNLYVATTRKSARQPDAGDLPVNENFRLGVAQALSAATRGTAWSCFEEERLGSLEVGKEADFVVVDMSFEAEDLLHAKVRQTWFGGKQVFAV